MFELDSKNHVPLWQLIYFMLRCNCPETAFREFHDDIRRHGGSTGNDLIKLLTLYIKYLQGSSQVAPSDIHGITTRVRGSLHRLIGAGCTDPYKCLLLPAVIYRLILFAILCNESPFSSITVTDQLNNTTCIVEQEVLSTLQDWLWYKLIIILLYQQVFHRLPTLSQAASAEEYSFEYLQNYIQNCDTAAFDMNGTKPFSYIQILLIISRYDEAIQYLLNHNYFIPAVMLSLLLYYYGVLSENDNRDNYYYVCVARILPQLRNRVDLATYLISAVRDASVKMNFCIVGKRRCVKDRSCWCCPASLSRSWAGSSTPVSAAMRACSTS